MFDNEVNQELQKICLKIEKRYEIKFLEIGTDKDHVHFLGQPVPMHPIKKIIQMNKNLIEKNVQKISRIKNQL